MTYQVLARKYRPQRFADVVGQEPVVRTLTNALSEARVHHAYVFSGIRGIGKTTSARLLARALNCEKGPTPEPCGTCPACVEIAQGRSLDAIEIDAASNRGIDEIKGLIQTAQYSPARDRHKVFIVDEFHMLTREAFNALLKTLEEPPAHVVFILATTELEKVPATILSRCLLLQFRPVGAAELRDHLLDIASREAVQLDPAAADLLARKAGGSLRDAHSTLDRVIALAGNAISREAVADVLGVCDARVLRGFLRAAIEGDAARALGILDDVVRGGADLPAFLEDLVAEARSLLLVRVLGSAAASSAGLSDDDARELAELAALASAEDCQRVLDRLLDAGPRLRQASEPRFVLEALAVRLAHLTRLEPLADLARRLADAEAAAPLALAAPAMAAPSAAAAPSERPAPAPGPSASAPPAPPPAAAPPAGSASWRTRAASAVAAPPEVAPAPAPQPDPGPRSSASRPARAAVASATPLEDFRSGLSARLRGHLDTGVVRRRDDGVLVALPEDRAASLQGLEEHRFHLVAAAAAAFGRPVPVALELVSGLLAQEAAKDEVAGDELVARRRGSAAKSSGAVQAVVSRFDGRIAGVVRPGQVELDEVP